MAWQSCGIPDGTLDKAIITRLTAFTPKNNLFQSIWPPLVDVFVPSRSMVHDGKDDFKRLAGYLACYLLASNEKK
jgi:hypothetical protein